ncbi:hypothetical protein SD77_4000 [Bacillus badius]|uniref:Uncharacterized protein n=1 Tax=Bacillus badius TaxID=1455 RepID=A0ABR5AUA8_BACBA|nr:hypothetical protein SD78_0848 [Bacillus badius]KIL78320.1 hypothetical protein SD77_4000 [Bacillus badius]
MEKHLVDPLKDRAFKNRKKEEKIFTWDIMMNFSASLDVWDYISL